MKKSGYKKQKNFLIIMLVVLILLGVFSRKTFGETILTVTDNKIQTSETFTSRGGNYSIGYILRNYGLFSFKDIAGSHVVGPIVAKERVFKTDPNGNTLDPINDTLIVSDLSNNVSSYVGNIESQKSELKPTFAMNHSYNIDKSVPNFYTNYSNVNIWKELKQYKLYKDSKTSSFLSPNNGLEGAGSGGIFQNDNFIDFQEAKKFIMEDSIRISNIPGKVVSPDPVTGYLKIIAGSNYIINDASNLRVIDFVFPSGYDGVTKVYPYPTFINIVGNNLSLSGKVFSAMQLTKQNGDVGDYISALTLPKINNENYQFFPQVYVNGIAFNGTIPGSTNNVDYGENLNILWNLPNIKTLDGGNKVGIIGGGEILGHIVAPNAQFYNYVVAWDGKINWAGGNINGAVIADSWYGGKREVHYWPYKDDLSNPVFKEFYIKAKKNYTGKALVGGDFKFKLEILSGGMVVDGINTVNMPQEISNRSDGTINFLPIEFTKAGTYTFSIKEVIGTDKKTTYDKSEYKLTAVVKKNDMLNSFEVTSIIDKVVDSNGVSLGNSPQRVNEIQFSNEYDYRLPSTGGTGSEGFLVLGLVVIIFSLGLFGWKRYKTN